MRILVVEDEPGIANFVRQGLTEAGYAVDLAWDGREGLDYALAAEYDVLVLDIMLPKIGGILGASLGVIFVVAVSAFQIWTPVLDPVAPFLAPLIGGAIGLLSGSYPALRAANLEPVEAVRAGT